MDIPMSYYYNIVNTSIRNRGDHPGITVVIFLYALLIKS